MKAFLLIVLVAPCSVYSQSRADTEAASTLRSEYISTAKTLLLTLERLQGVQAKKWLRAKSLWDQSRDMYAERLVPLSDVRKKEEEALAAKRELDDTEKQIDDANQQLSELPTVSVLAKEFRKARRLDKGCKNWTLTVSRRESKKATALSFKVACHR